MSQSGFGSSGTTTCRPLPPVVRQNDVRLSRCSRSRTSHAACATSENATPSPGSRSNHDHVRMLRIGLGGAPGMQLDRRDLRHGDQPVQIVDREIGRRSDPALANPIRQRAMAVLLEEVLAADALRDSARSRADVWQDLAARASATVCQYSARSCLVMPGQSSRSGWVSVTPCSSTLRALGARAVTMDCSRGGAAPAVAQRSSGRAWCWRIRLMAAAESRHDAPPRDQRRYAPRPRPACPRAGRDTPNA